MNDNTSKCTNPRLRKFVSLYQMNLLPDELKTTVEAHLLECSMCFGDLYKFSALTEVIEEKPELFRESLQIRLTTTEKWLRFFKDIAHMVKRRFRLLLPIPIPTWIKFGIKILVPVTAIAILVLFLYHPSKQQYTDLAIIEHALYQPLSLRGPGISPATEMLFIDGMERYRQLDYPAATIKLITYAERQPNDAVGYFYLGVSWLLQNEINKCIETLLRAKTLSHQQQQQILYERCVWYLGNAYLKQNEPELALNEFQKIVAAKGELARDAQQQLARIQARQASD